MNSRLSNELKAEARSLGFFACGIAQAQAVDDTTAHHMRAWLDNGNHAGMDYMGNHTDKRLDPRQLMPGVRSIVSVAMNYAPARHLPDSELQLAAYAYGEDYHDLVKNKLRQLAQQFGFKEINRQDEPAEADEGIHFRVFCDTAPILERYWAAQAGLGWIGRHHQLIIPKAGSMFFLGELLLDTELEYDQPMHSRCGTCRACTEACPTCAITPDGPLDANRCLSYHTIESRGDLPKEIAEKMGNTIYGCDQCLQACPWNRFATPNTTPELQPTPELLDMTREKWRTLTEDDYRRIFRKSAVKRAKYNGLMRNIRAITTNSQLQDNENEQPQSANRTNAPRD